MKTVMLKYISFILIQQGKLAFWLALISGALFSLADKEANISYLSDSLW